MSQKYNKRIINCVNIWSDKFFRLINGTTAILLKRLSHIAAYETQHLLQGESSVGIDRSVQPVCAAGSSCMLLKYPNQLKRHS